MMATSTCGVRIRIQHRLRVELEFAPHRFAISSLGNARLRFPGTSLQHLDVAFRKPDLTDFACGKLNDPIGKLDLILGSDDFPIVHQQDQIADGERRAFVRVIEWMTDRKRVHGKGGYLLDRRIFEPVGQIHLDSSENGANRSADSGARQSALSSQQMLMQVGDLLFRR